ncbi:MAG: class I SAM-dependent methyltransferase [Burkholderiales bacterium]|nr:class I SAM-dependent methyltransferase [Burkholderiales bacterium]
MTNHRCRFCGTALNVTFCDLGLSPLSNAFVKPAEANRGEVFYPLHARTCPECLLVQLDEFEKPDHIFHDYAYFSSYSESWLEHARTYAEGMTGALGLGEGSLVLEVASNDGYLLQYFQRAGIPVLGVEPARNVAEVARARGIRTVSEFFGRATATRLASEFGRADLIVANNVIAHVPDLNDFVSGFLPMLKADAVLTVEFPHLLRLIEEGQFDTMYHEHFSYFSFATLQRVLERHGLSVHDVEQIPTHGGSLRVHASPAAVGRKASDRVAAILESESVAGLGRIETYADFSGRAERSKWALLTLLIDLKRNGKSIVGYGAPAKGNTLLNYCGIRSDFLPFTVDRSPHKQGLLLPGTRIPVYSPEKIAATRPDYVLILPWNLREEIAEQMAFIRDWGGRFIVPIPTATVF